MILILVLFEAFIQITKNFKLAKLYFFKHKLKFVKNLILSFEFIKIIDYEQQIGVSDTNQCFFNLSENDIIL
jgi:hypothetical protein